MKVSTKSSKYIPEVGDLFTYTRAKDPDKTGVYIRVDDGDERRIFGALPHPGFYCFVIADNYGDDNRISWFKFEEPGIDYVKLNPVNNGKIFEPK